MKWPRYGQIDIMYLATSSLGDYTKSFVYRSVKVLLQHVSTNFGLSIVSPYTKSPPLDSFAGIILEQRVPFSASIIIKMICLTSTQAILFEIMITAWPGGIPLICNNAQK